MKDRSEELYQQALELLRKAGEDSQLNKADRKAISFFLTTAINFLYYVNTRFEVPAYEPTSDDVYKFSRACWLMGAAQAHIKLCRQPQESNE